MAQINRFFFLLFLFLATAALAAKAAGADVRKLRVVVFGQEGLSNSYAVDAAGFITMPLIGAVPAHGRTTTSLSRAIAEKLRNGYIREPHVAGEVEAYRPFFILGEVTAPGQYPYVANMTAETAIDRVNRRDRRRIAVVRRPHVGKLGVP